MHFQLSPLIFFTLHFYSSKFAFLTAEVSLYLHTHDFSLLTSHFFFTLSLHNVSHNICLFGFLTSDFSLPFHTHDLSLLTSHFIFSSVFSRFPDCLQKRSEVEFRENFCAGPRGLRAESFDYQCQNYFAYGPSYTECYNTVSTRILTVITSQSE